jgi:hypothetical protein
MRSLGVVPFDEASLRAALTTDQAEHHDSDGDGDFDIDELRAGRDPNDGSAGQLPLPEYGCGASVAAWQATTGDWPTVALVSMIVGLAICRRRAPR